MFEEQEDQIIISDQQKYYEYCHQQILEILLQESQYVYQEILKLHLQINDLISKKNFFEAEKKIALEIKEKIVIEAGKKVNFSEKIIYCHQLKNNIKEKNQITDPIQRLQERTMLALKLEQTYFELIQCIKKELEDRKVTLQIQEINLQEIEKELQLIEIRLIELHNQLLEKNTIIIQITQELIEINQIRMELTSNPLLYSQQLSNSSQFNISNEPQPPAPYIKRKTTTSNATDHKQPNAKVLRY